MRLLTTAFQFMQSRHLLFPAILVAINVGCSVSAFKAGDYKRGVYWLSSALCLAMVSI